MMIIVGMCVCVCVCSLPSQCEYDAYKCEHSNTEREKRKKMHIKDARPNHITTLSKQAMSLDIEMIAVVVVLMYTRKWGRENTLIYVCVCVRYSDSIRQPGTMITFTILLWSPQNVCDEISSFSVHLHFASRFFGRHINIINLFNPNETERDRENKQKKIARATKPENLHIGRFVLTMRKLFRSKNLNQTKPEFKIWIDHSFFLSSFLLNVKFKKKKKLIDALGLLVSMKNMMPGWLAITHLAP